MKGEERQLVQVLIEHDIVPEKTVRKLLKLKAKYEENDRNVSLPQLLVKKDILSRERVKRILGKIRKRQEKQKRTSAPPPEQEKETRETPDRKKRRSPGRSRRNRVPHHSREPSGSTQEETGSDDKAEEPVPGYLVRDVIGKGGVGAVFRVEEKETGDEYALKVMFPHHAQDERAVKRFVREGKLLKAFDHPNLVQGYEYGQHENLFYQVLQLIRGRPILDIIRESGPIHEEQALDIILQVADALRYIQEQGIIHRDVKPENVMLNDEGHAYLVDLGFAKKMGADPEQDEGTTLGTAQYMSPEQAKGQEDLDIRSDIYSLGVTLYHMVVGDVPFQGEENQEIMAQQVMENLQGEEVKSKMSHHTHYFIEKMMSKEADFRFQNADEVIRDISDHLEAIEEMEFDPEEEEFDPFH